MGGSMDCRSIVIGVRGRQLDSRRKLSFRLCSSKAKRFRDTDVHGNSRWRRDRSLGAHLTIHLKRAANVKPALVTDQGGLSN